MANNQTPIRTVPIRPPAGDRAAGMRRGSGIFRRNPRTRRFFLFTSLGTLTLVAILLVWTLITVRSIARDLPSVDKIADIRAQQPTTIVSSDGVVLAALQTQYRRPVSLTEISPRLIDATIATEDSRFYTHKGVDTRGILRAVLGNIRSGNTGGQGGSTITQQLARNIFLTPRKTLRRKVEEMLLARKIEQQYSKKEILEAYLNTIYYGNGAYGAEAAARTYFGKSAKELTYGEAALLAGLPQRPTAYNPDQHRTAALKRRGEVLARMVATGRITPQQQAQAEVAPLHILHHRLGMQADWKAPYFVSEVLAQLRDKYGEEFLYSGARIETTLNWSMQRAAERALARALRGGHGPNTGCLVSLDPHTGYVRALVGGPDFRKDQFDAAVRGLRQPGSAFKPIVYATAFDNNICNLTTIFEDKKLTYEMNPGTWVVHNYESGYRGKVGVLDALRQSINTVAVQVNEQTGPATTVDYAEKFGLTTTLEPNLPLALGASAVHPIELCSAYSVFADAGNRYDPAFIVRVLDVHKQELLHDEPNARLHTNFLNQRTLEQMNVALREVVLHGTGVAAAGVPDAHGKTGTTSSHRDAWFVGYTSHLATAVWLGHVHRQMKKAIDGTKTMTVTYLPMPGQTGGQIAAPVWARFMTVAIPIQQHVDAAHGVPGKPIQAPETDKMLTMLQEDARQAALAAASADSNAPGNGNTVANAPDLPLNGGPPITSTAPQDSTRDTSDQARQQAQTAQDPNTGGTQDNASGQSAASPDDPARYRREERPANDDAGLSADEQKDRESGLRQLEHGGGDNGR